MLTDQPFTVFETTDEAFAKRLEGFVEIEIAESGELVTSWLARAVGCELPARCEQAGTALGRVPRR